MTKPKNRGSFEPGTSGNPKGRPRGSGDVAKLRASIAKHVPDIITKLVEQAKNGDTGAARLLLERAVPPIKAAEQPVPIQLPDGTLTEQGRAVLVAAGAGSLAPGQAASMLTGLSALAKLVETDQHAERLAAIEDRLGISSKRHPD